MQKLLSLCIPTFNRAQCLQRQLAWLAKETQDFGDDCEIIISDNCSEDETSTIVQEWQAAFHHISFHSNRNHQNVGWMRNFVYCLNAASGRYTWIIGDDDVIYDGTVAYVIKTLRERSGLSLFYLNFCERNTVTGAFNPIGWFKTSPEDDQIRDGKVLFQKHLQDNIGSVIFVSATIFSTQLGREALLSWQDSQNNWAGLAYWNGYCATQGSVFVTHETYLECTLGVSYWQKDPQAWFRIRYQDIPKIYTKLQQIGYPRAFCRRMMLNLLKEDFLGPRVKSMLKYYVWCFLKNPLQSSKNTGTYIYCLFISVFSIYSSYESQNRSRITSITESLSTN